MLLFPRTEEEGEEGTHSQVEDPLEELEGRVLSFDGAGRGERGEERRR